MDTIGRYRLGRRLGAGSFATVWLGHDDNLDLEVAVKILAENWVDNTDVHNRFLAEARIMRRIRDERIVGVFDIGELPDGRPYFVMDYCDAGSLADIRRNPGSPKATLRLCAEAARALDVLHHHQVVHRDVTPGNLLLDTNPDGSLRLRLADLGVAKEMIGQQGLTMTAGTPAYMAPEQATGRAVDPRADVYALACVTYAVLTGQPPFPVKTVQDLLARQPNTKPVPLAARVGAPPHLDGLLQAALSLDPAQRPQTAGVMAEAFDHIANAMAGPDVTRQTNPQPPIAPVSPQTFPDQAFPDPGHPDRTRKHPHPGAPHHPPLPVPPIQPVFRTPDFADQSVADAGPGWKFWALVGLGGVFVFLGALFLTLFLVS